MENEQQIFGLIHQFTFVFSMMVSSALLFIWCLYYLLSRGKLAKTTLRPISKDWFASVCFIIISYLSWYRFWLHRHVWNLTALKFYSFSRPIFSTLFIEVTFLSSLSPLGCLVVNYLSHLSNLYYLRRHRRTSQQGLPSMAQPREKEDTAQEYGEVHCRSGEEENGFLRQWSWKVTRMDTRSK